MRLSHSFVALYVARCSIDLGPRFMFFLFSLGVPGRSPSSSTLRSVAEEFRFNDS